MDALIYWQADRIATLKAERDALKDALEAVIAETRFCGTIGHEVLDKARAALRQVQE